MPEFEKRSAGADGVSYNPFDDEPADGAADTPANGTNVRALFGTPGKADAANLEAEAMEAQPPAADAVAPPPPGCCRCCTCCGHPAMRPCAEFGTRLYHRVGLLVALFSLSTREM